ncbi:hypothetical protein [Bacillus thuringiensis]|nr:hypothetical protein [Bacillus thuringiensis]
MHVGVLMELFQFNMTIFIPTLDILVIVAKDKFQQHSHFTSKRL